MPLQFLSLSGGVQNICRSNAAIGMFGGMFIVPLYAMVQSRTESHKRARVIAANNVFNAIFMVSGRIDRHCLSEYCADEHSTIFCPDVGRQFAIFNAIDLASARIQASLFAWITNNR